MLIYYIFIEQHVRVTKNSKDVQDINYKYIRITITRFNVHRQHNLIFFMSNQ